MTGSRIQALMADAIAHQNAGRLAKAEPLYRQVLALDPFHGGALNMLGVIAFRGGRSDQAAELLRKAVAANGRDAAAHMHLGLALRALGRADEAMACYRRALEIEPNFAEAHTNLANLFWEQGKLADAEAGYRRLLAIRPNDVLALNNFAALRMMQGDFVGAMDLVWRSLAIGETPKARGLFARLARQLRLEEDDAAVRAVMVRALGEPWTRPSTIAQSAADLVRLAPHAGGALARAAAAWPKSLSAPELFGPEGAAAFARDALFMTLIGATQNIDIAMERFLTLARRLLLEATEASGEMNTAELEFFCALAGQCFINEYVFFQGAEESQAAAARRAALETALTAGTPVPPSWVAAVAAYFPLHQLAQASRLAERPWPAPVAALVVQQIGEPEEERRLGAAIPRLTALDDAISHMVRAQYEENPYPRWIKTAPPEEPGNFVFDLGQKFSVPIRHHGRGGPTEILIAGCGTGQYAIEMARKYSDARFLAVDLSLASLAYACRKARALGLTGIGFAQADLLGLGRLDRDFDVIECGGVLHHLADPWAGWRVLLSRLRPGGFMQLGFYSLTGRRNILEARKTIAARGFRATAGDIRQCRQELIDAGGKFQATVTSEDFFSISSCRDLIFHVQEQQVTLADIDVFLKANRLTFLGFDIAGPVRHAYAGQFPQDTLGIDLAQWQRFEDAHPDTFAGMYNFWIQKPA